MAKINFGPAEITHRNPFLEIRHTRAEFGDFSKDYYVVHFGPRVGVVASRNGHILLVRQYRFLVNNMSWEIPGGKIEIEESPEVAGERECIEETGLRCRNLKPLVVYYPGLDNVDNRTTVLYSEEVDDAAPFIADKTEVTEIAWIPLNECLKMVFNGEILDALTVTGLLAYQSKVQGSSVR